MCIRLFISAPLLWLYGSIYFGQDIAEISSSVSLGDMGLLVCQRHEIIYFVSMGYGFKNCGIKISYITHVCYFPFNKVFFKPLYLVYIHLGYNLKKGRKERKLFLNLKNHRKEEDALREVNHLRNYYIYLTTFCIYYILIKLLWCA